MSAQEFVVLPVLVLYVLVMYGFWKVSGFLANVIERNEPAIGRAVVTTCLLIARFVRFICTTTQDMNDERIIRSIERDVVNTARRMNKVASR